MVEDGERTTTTTTSQGRGGLLTFIMSSGRRVPIPEIPIPAFDVPYAAPIAVVEQQRATASAFEGGSSSPPLAVAQRRAVAATRLLEQ